VYIFKENLETTLLFLETHALVQGKLSRKNYCGKWPKEQSVCTATYCFAPDFNFWIKKKEKKHAEKKCHPGVDLVSDSHPDLTTTQTRFLTRRCKNAATEDARASPACELLAQSMTALQKALLIFVLIMLSIHKY